MDETLHLAKILWDHHVLHEQIKKSDCIIALGNSDLRTATRAAELFNQGMGGLLVVTGGFGRLTKDNFTKPEAHIFAEEAKKFGIPDDKIIIEDVSTNTFDNIRFTKKILMNKNINAKSFLLVTKPYMERRALETFKSAWPDVSVQVTSPALNFDDYPNATISQELLINMVVGDLQRLMILSKSGHITHQEFPDEVIAAFNKLVERGYTKQIVPPENIKNLLAAISSNN